MSEHNKSHAALKDILIYFRIQSNSKYKDALTMQPVIITIDLFATP